MLDDLDLHRYARQLILPRFDEESQEKLASSTVLLIGAGGIGAPLCLYLAAAGIGKLIILDGDKIEISNLNRQVCFTENEIGMPKAEAAADMARQLNPRITVLAENTHLDAENATRLIKKGMVIADATDTPTSRLMINNIAHAKGCAVVFGGAIRLEGQLATFRSGLNQDMPCFCCVFPETDSSSLVPRCQDVGILGAITGVIGSMMALEVLRQCLLPLTPLGGHLGGKLLLYDGMDNRLDMIRVTPRTDCPTCGIASAVQNPRP